MNLNQISTPNTDEYGEVINGPHTYHLIAKELRWEGSCVIGWTDQQFSHYDILFTLRPKQYGSLQGGLRGGTDLFVSIMRIGCFAFDVTPRELHIDYIQEKLGVHSKPLTDLINNIIIHI